MTTAVSSTVDCLVSWAGPVDLPLRGEADVQAACGLMHVHGRRYGRPTPLGVDYASIAAGLLAVQGALAARLGGLRGVPIGRVSTSVAQAALLGVAPYLAAATAGDAEVLGGPGGPPFTSADGVRFELETTEPRPWQRFWAVLGAPEIEVRRGWRPFRHRYATATCPLPAELHRAARAVDFAAVLDAAALAGVSVVAVRESWAEQMRPWRVKPISGPRAAPGLGTGVGLPLDGLVAVESGRCATPLAGHLLRLLGAAVVRVEPPGGDPRRAAPPTSGGHSARYLAFNRGKQVVEADLTTPAGRSAVRELVANADVFVHSWSPGRSGTFGLAASDLVRVRPGLVYAWASGGGDRPLPPADADYLVQADSGLAAVAGASLMTLTDVLGGLACATGVLTGLVARARTGFGQRVDSSLLSAAMTARHARPVAPVPRTVDVCTDLAALAADPRFSAALELDGCCHVRAPWTFEP
jgi:crotonobetainyl-CoA:carnitine CoA-transferase CaiB-like acyl-CoA transferase